LFAVTSVQETLRGIERMMRRDRQSSILTSLSFNQTLPQFVGQLNEVYADTEVLKGLGSPRVTAGGERRCGRMIAQAKY
jgi:hypothetical protein